MAIEFNKWVKGTHQSCTDPTEWNGTNPNCKVGECEKQIEMNDEYCEDHQRCVMCGDNDDCECKDEWSGVSSCCEAKMNTDTKMCYECKDHCDSVWETENDNQPKRIVNEKRN